MKTGDNTDRRVKRRPRRSQRQAIRETAADAQRFARAHRAEAMYARDLLQIARNVWNLIKGFNPSDAPGEMARITDALNRYSDLITPWAKSAATKMLHDVARRDQQAWQAHAAEIGKSLRQEIKSAPTGQALRLLLDEQVALIKSLPIDAAKRVHELTQRGLTIGGRPLALEKQIAALGVQPTPAEEARGVVPTDQWIRNRARLIARTEVARTASVLTQVRAQHIGCTQYTWRTSHDGNVRPTHKALDGKVFRFDDPPVTEADGTTRANPGQVWNCRCTASPLIPEDL